MTLVKEVPTRDLLRNFKKYKEMLIQGKIKHIVLPVDKENKLEITLRKEMNTGMNIAEMFSNLLAPIEIERTDIIDELIMKR